MARRNEGAPDPLGKRALFWAPGAEAAMEQPGSSESTTPLPVGKRALYSGARPEPDSAAATSENPLLGRGAFRVVCERCRQTSQVGALDLLIFQLPVGFWLPGKRFDHRMTCPSCRRRSWCSVTLHRR